MCKCRFCKVLKSRVSPFSSFIVPYCEIEGNFIDVVNDDGCPNFIFCDDVSTKELVEELSKREGVKTINVEPYTKGNIEVDGSVIVLQIED